MSNEHGSTTMPMTPESTRLLREICDALEDIDKESFPHLHVGMVAAVEALAAFERSAGEAAMTVALGDYAIQFTEARFLARDADHARSVGEVVAFISRSSSPAPSLVVEVLVETLGAGHRGLAHDAARSCMAAVLELACLSREAEGEGEFAGTGFRGLLVWCAVDMCEAIAGVGGEAAAADFIAWTRGLWSDGAASMPAATAQSAATHAHA